MIPKCMLHVGKIVCLHYNIREQYVYRYGSHEIKINQKAEKYINKDYKLTWNLLTVFIEVTLMGQRDI